MALSIEQYIGGKVKDQLESPIFSFPQDLYLLQHSRDLTVHAMWTDRKEHHGLAVFTNKHAAEYYCEFIDIPGFNVKEVGFERAREIAIEKSDYLDAINCLALCDNVKDVKIHYIK